MSNLIPEQRVDKNGVAVTRHVRATQKPATGKSFPAPKAVSQPKEAVPAKKPTKRQLEQRLRHIRTNRNGIDVDAGLMKGLGVDHSTQFRASDVEIFDVMAVASPGDALMLLKAGVKTSHDAMERLDELGLSRLMEDNSVLSRELLNRRIFPEIYFIDLDAYGSDTPHFLDVVEFDSIDALSDLPEFAREIRAGVININDIKAFGVRRLKKTGDSKTGASTEAATFLREYAAGTTRTTMSDAKAIFDKYTHSNLEVSGALKLNKKYGGEFGIDIEPTHDIMRRSHRLENMGLDRDYAAEVIRYSIQIRDVFRGNHEPVQVPVEEALCQYYDYGAKPEDVANGLTIQQLDAMDNNGIAPSVSGGWL